MAVASSTSNMPQMISDYIGNYLGRFTRFPGPRHDMSVVNVSTHWSLQPCAGDMDQGLEEGARERPVMPLSPRLPNSLLWL